MGPAFPVPTGSWELYFPTYPFAAKNEAALALAFPAAADAFSRAGKLCTDAVPLYFGLSPSMLSGPYSRSNRPDQQSPTEVMGMATSYCTSFMREGVR